MINIGNYVSFNLPGSDGKNHRTEDYQGKVIVLYTYPKDLTPGCTNQACGFRNLNEEFKNHNAVILCLNKDSLKTHEKFVNKHQLSFPLLTDQDGELLNLLGALKDNKLMRNTYIIDEEGKLELALTQVKASENPDDVLSYLKQRKSK